MSKTSDGEKQSSMTPDIDIVIKINKFGAPFVNIEGTFSLSTWFDCGFSPLKVPANQGAFLLYRIFVVNFVFEIASVRFSGVVAVQGAKLCELSPSKRHGMKQVFFLVALRAPGPVYLDSFSGLFRYLYGVRLMLTQIWRLE
jgi:hypothetical protein